MVYTPDPELIGVTPLIYSFSIIVLILLVFLDELFKDMLFSFRSLFEGHFEILVYGKGG